MVHSPIAGSSLYGDSGEKACRAADRLETLPDTCKPCSDRERSRRDGAGERAMPVATAVGCAVDPLAETPCAGRIRFKRSAKGGRQQPRKDGISRCRVRGGDDERHGSSDVERRCSNHCGHTARERPFRRPRDHAPGGLGNVEGLWLASAAAMLSESLIGFDWVFLSGRVWRLARMRRALISADRGRALAECQASRRVWLSPPTDRHLYQQRALPDTLAKPPT